MKNPQDIRLSRRTHLQSLLAAAIATAVPGVLPALAAERPASAPDLPHLDTAQANILLSVARTLFPHDMLGDRFYWPIVASIDAAMADEASGKRVMAGLALLDTGFVEFDQPAREAELGKFEGGPFFALVYNATISGLYTNGELWQLFGYEGSSVEHGGYINRGFDEVDWLPKDEEGVQ